jgi:hypothetical protein
MAYTCWTVILFELSTVPSPKLQPSAHVCTDDMTEKVIDSVAKGLEGVYVKPVEDEHTDTVTV